MELPLAFSIAKTNNTQVIMLYKQATDTVAT